MSNEQTVGDKLAAEVGALIRARNPLLWVVTPEELRVERALIDVAGEAKYNVRVWDCAAGVTDALGQPVPDIRGAYEPIPMLAALRDNKQRAIWILRDLPFWLREPSTLRAVRNLARVLPARPPNEAVTMVIVSPSSEVPPELQDHAIVIKWKLPDRPELSRVFTSVIKSLRKDDLPTPDWEEAEKMREAAIEAAVGLTAEAAKACYSKSLVTQKRKIVPAIISEEKRRVVSGKGIEWFDPDPRGLDAIGGLAFLKSWLVARRAAFSQRARDYGLPYPKGIMLLGPPGTGKSLTAKAVSAAWGVPLLKLDMGGARSKWVGESEENIRAALAVADTVGNCVVWIDEIEKALGGATGGAADGGVSSDALGTLLSWMQERKGGAFVIATSNDVRALPPELLRKGRFDELFYVDLPTTAERADILRVTLRQFARDPETIRVGEVAGACPGFVGAELAALVPAALFAAFADGERALTTEDLIREAKVTTPLSKTASEKIEGLRQWAKDRARPASASQETVVDVSGDRALDLS